MIILKQSPADVLRMKLTGAVTTNELPIYCAFVDRTTTTFNPDNNNTVSNGTTYVNIAGTPAASTQRQVKFFSIQNSDTVSATVIVEHYNATNGRQLCKVTLAVNDTLMYADGEGFRVIDSSGQIKQSTSTSGVLLAANNLSDLASASTARTNLGITESTYTPTLTNTTNVAASTAYTTYYQRIGNKVYVWGQVDVDVTTGSATTVLGFSIPVASNFGNTYELGGTAITTSNTINVFSINADTANDRATFQGAPPSTANIRYNFMFSYTVI